MAYTPKPTTEVVSGKAVKADHIANLYDNFDAFAIGASGAPNIEFDAFNTLFTSGSYSVTSTGTPDVFIIPKGIYIASLYKTSASGSGQFGIDLGSGFVNEDLSTYSSSTIILRTVISDGINVRISVDGTVGANATMDYRKVL